MNRVKFNILVTTLQWIKCPSWNLKTPLNHKQITININYFQFSSININYFQLSSTLTFGADPNKNSTHSNTSFLTAEKYVKVFFIKFK